MNVNWSRIIGNVGRTLIGTGTLILLFVVYQLWGTAIQERRAQNELRSEFAAALEGTGFEVDQFALDQIVLPATLDSRAITPAASVRPDAIAADIELTQDDPEPVTDVIDASFLPEGILSSDHGPPPPPAEDGEAIAELRIPRIGVTKTIVEGVTTDQLKKGPGHYPGTPLPGQAGNASIAGHRTTYGAPFNRLDELEVNDLIYVTTLQGSFVYRVTEQLIVSPRDVWVLDPSEDNRLTLTTCHPKYSARQRLVVVAELIGEPAEGDPTQLAGAGEVELPSEDIVESTTTTTIDPSQDDDDVVVAAPITTVPPSTTIARGLVATEISHGGLDGVQGARWPAVLWGLLAAATAFTVWYSAQRWQKWIMYGIGSPIFLLVLFFFFEAFSSLLPPGV